MARLMVNIRYGIWYFWPPVVALTDCCCCWTNMVIYVYHEIICRTMEWKRTIPTDYQLTTSWIPVIKNAHMGCIKRKASYILVSILLLVWHRLYSYSIWFGSLKSRSHTKSRIGVSWSYTQPSSSGYENGSWLKAPFTVMPPIDCNVQGSSHGKFTRQQ